VINLISVVINTHFPSSGRPAHDDVIKFLEEVTLGDRGKDRQVITFMTYNQQSE